MHVDATPSVDEHIMAPQFLCKRLGRFVRHWPERPDAERAGEYALTRTVALIEQTGHTVDSALWTGDPPGALETVTGARPGGRRRRTGAGTPPQAAERAQRPVALPRAGQW